MKKLYLAIFIFFVLIFSIYANVPKHRDFIFDYELVIKDIPSEASEVKIWIPFPAEKSYQIIEDEIEGSKWLSSTTYDRKYRNKILYYTIKNPKDSSIKVSMRYKIKRYEYSHKPAAYVQQEALSDVELNNYLLPSRLVTISPQVKELASGITQGKDTTIDKARAIYDYVFKNVSYDKTIPGWGWGDTERVCLLKSGNCTDFHSLFISLARASGIPAKFVMGVLLPKKNKGSLKSYHCWAEFYAEGFGWIPIDISEAWKDKSKYEYHFGTIDENRVEFTQGRDIVLEPPQKNTPLNYFIYPYVEIDGKVFENVDTTFVVQDNNLKGGG